MPEKWLMWLILYVDLFILDVLIILLSGCLLIVSLSSYLFMQRYYTKCAHVLTQEIRAKWLGLQCSRHSLCIAALPKWFRIHLSKVCMALYIRSRNVFNICIWSCCCTHACNHTCGYPRWLRMSVTRTCTGMSSMCLEGLMHEPTRGPYALTH